MEKIEKYQNAIHKIQCMELEFSMLNIVIRKIQQRLLHENRKLCLASALIRLEETVFLLQTYDKLCSKL